MDLTRRRFFGFLAAPAIVRAASIMPVKSLLPELFVGEWRGVEFIDNHLLTPTIITRETLKILTKNLIAAQKMGIYPFHKGRAITVRKPLFRV